MEQGTSTDHVQAVLSIDDRVLRNYWVTQSYSDLAAGLAALLGPDTPTGARSVPGPRVPSAGTSEERTCPSGCTDGWCSPTG